MNAAEVAALVSASRLNAPTSEKTYTRSERAASSSSKSDGSKNSSSSSTPASASGSGRYTAAKVSAQFGI